MLKKRLAWILAAALTLTSVPMPGSTARASEKILPINQETEIGQAEETESVLEQETDEIMQLEETPEAEKVPSEDKQEALKKKKTLALSSGLTVPRSVRVTTGSIVSMPEIVPEPLSLGEHVAKVLSGGAWYNINITAENEGGYRIYSTSNDDTYVEAYRKNENGKLTCVGKNDDGGAGTNFQLTIPLESGNEYYYKIRYYSDSRTGEIPYTFEAMPRVTTLSVTGNTGKAVPECLNDLYNRLQMDITYDNGERDQISAVKKVDHAGNPVRKIWYADAAGTTEVATEDLKEGTKYFLLLSVGSARSQMLEVLMCASEDAFEEIKMGDQELVGKRYYKFVADEAGYYTFDMQSAAILNIYNSQMQRYTRNYGTKSSIWLNNGINYIKSSSNISLNIRKTRTLQSIKLVHAGAKIPEGNSLVPSLAENGCKFQITYEGGATEECGMDAPTADGVWLTVNDVTDVNGQWVSTWTSEAGNYRVTVSCMNVDVTFDLQIYPIDQVYAQLQLGENVLAEAGNFGAGYYFKAPEAGTYAFRVLSGSGSADYKSLRPGKRINRTMKKDEIYSFSWTSESGARIRVEQVVKKTIQSVQADPVTYICAPGKQRVDRITPKNGVKVTYTDGTAEYVQDDGSYYSEDKYGNKIYWNLYRADKTGIVYGRPRPGDYYLRLFGDFQDIYVPVKVLSFADAEKKEMKASDTVTVKDQDVFCGSFTPEKDGKYVFYANADMTFRIVDENGGKPEYYKYNQYDSPRSLAAGLDNTYAAKASIATGGWNERFARWFAVLKAGVTYQFYVKADDTRKYCLTLEEAPVVTDMSLQMDRKEYIAGLEELWNIEPRVKLSYSDGTDCTMDVQETDIYGNRFANYEILKDGEPADLSAGLQKGEYLAKVSLCTSSMTAEVGFQGVDEQEAKLATIKEGEWKDDIPFGMPGSWFLFTPQKSGSYSLRFEAIMGIAATGRDVTATVFFYEKTEQGYSRVDWGQDLQAGVTYLTKIIRYEYDGGRLQICYSGDWGKEEIKPVDGGILTNEVRGSLPAQAAAIVYTFTPDAEGDYVFRTDQELYIQVSEKNGDSYVNSGSGNVVAHLMAGTAYIVKVDNSYYGSKACSFTLSAALRTYKAIQKIELKRLDNEPLSQQTLFPGSLQEVWSHLAAELTYVDGEKDTLQLPQNIWNLVDRYGTEFQGEITELSAKETGTSCTYRYKLYTGNVSGCIDIQMTKAPAMKLGIPVSFNVKKGGKTGYEFVAPEDGLYYIDLSSDTLSMYVYSWSGKQEISSYSYNGLYQLSAGMRYSVYLNNWEWSSNARDVAGTITITKPAIKTVSDVEIVAPAEDEIYHSSQAVRLKNLKVKLSYQDGSSQVVECTQSRASNDNIKIHDGFGNILWFYFPTLSYKASQLVVMCGGYRDSQVITYKKLPNNGNTIPGGQKQGSVTLNAGADNSILTYSPAETACYRFDFMISGTDIMDWLVLDENEKALEYGYMFNGTYSEKAYWMEAGKKYYIVLTHAPLSQNAVLTYQIGTGNDQVHIHHMVTKIDKQPTCGQDGSQHRECTVCGYKETATAIKATGKHTYGAYVQTKEATVLAEGIKTRTCAVCGHKESAGIPKLAATMKVNVKSIVLQVKQSTTKVKVTGLAKGDFVKSWKSSNQKIVTVTNKGKIKAGKKTGSAKITITLASGKNAVVKVKVQKKKVTAKSIKVKKKVTLKAKRKIKLTPVVSPITCQDKLTYKTSNKKVAVVNKKGVVTGKKKGKAVITVKCGKKKVKVKVTVK